MEFKNVNEKIKKKWFISRLIFLVILAIGYINAILFIPKDVFGLYLGAVILYSILILLQIVNTFIFPKLQYKKYLYLIKEDEIVFYHGIIFIESVVIPMVQIQDIGFSQGPIELALGIASLDISTAGSNHYIAGFKKEEVEELVNSVKERIKKLVTDKNKGE